jgi:hypothetical protein
MSHISSVFTVCPQCKEETLEIVRVGEDRNFKLPSASSLNSLYASIRQAALAQCELCGYEIDGDDLIDFLERSLLEEGE